MTVSVSILDGPLPPWRSPAPDADVGAVVLFEGIVREDENGGLLEALDYQTYEPMAQTMLTRLAQQILERHALADIIVEHSRARVPVGACSFRLVITAGHRKPALAAADEFIDRLKQDVPIWKRPVWRTPPPTQR